MTKQLIIGLATVALTGTAILATGMYAATSTTSSTTTHTRMERGMNQEQMMSSLSGKVSAEALTALQTLMTKHKTEMDALKTANTDEATIKAKHESFKTEMDALLTKYPELKTAMPTPPNGGKMGRGGNGGKEQMDTLFASVSDTDKTAIKAIRDEYKTKQDTLRDEEKSKIDTIIAKYPELKTKLDTLEKNRENGMGHGRNRSEETKESSSAQ